MEVLEVRVEGGGLGAAEAACGVPSWGSEGWEADRARVS